MGGMGGSTSGSINAHASGGGGGGNHGLQGSTNSALPPISKKGQALQSLKIDLRGGSQMPGGGGKHGSNSMSSKYKSMHSSSNFYHQEKAKRRMGGNHGGGNYGGKNYGHSQNYNYQHKMQRKQQGFSSKFGGIKYGMGSNSGSVANAARRQERDRGGGKYLSPYSQKYMSKRS
eukprot:g2972.t1